MSNLKLDNVYFSSFHESFKNRQILTTTIDITGSVGPGTAAQFIKDLTITRDLSFAEVYYEKVGGSTRRKADSGIVLYDFSGPGLPRILVTYPAANTLRVNIAVFNNGGSSITLTDQSYDIIVYVLDAPFTT